MPVAVPVDPHLPYQEFTHPERLVSAPWLSARLGVPGLRVLESNEDALLYDIGHIPTAMRLNPADLSAPVTRDLIDGEAFAELMRSKGISRDDTVVIYGDRFNWWAAYTLWVFDLFGHPDVRLLDGGREAWMTEERDTSFIVPENPTSEYPVVDRNDAQSRIFVQEIVSALDSSEGIALLDARGTEEFLGRAESSTAAVRGIMRAGHIPGAVNVPWDQTMHPNGTFRSCEELREHFSAFDAAQKTFLYSSIGARSAHTWFVLKYLMGFETVFHYDGGWAEWGNMMRMPIELEST